VLTSRYLTARSLLPAIALLGSALVLGGCGSAQNGINSALPASNAASSTVQPDKCKYQGGVRATPCRVQLSASNPGPITVTLRTPHGSKGSVVEHDSCGGASGVATISGSGTTWYVTAGATSGACKARFNYFNNAQKVGWVRITIQNSI
jgi:hypothetical protein